MGNCASPNSEDAKNSKAIEQQLLIDSREAKQETKLLLLGPGECGKSTIVKQLRILYNNGFSKDDRLGYKTTIHSNVIMSMSALVKALQKSNQIQELDGELQQSALLLTSPEIQACTELTKEISEAVISLWKCEIVKLRFDNKSDVQIIDSAAYFFDEMDRISAIDYLPTERDLLFSRTRTTGIIEICFRLAGCPLRLVDVGGQRSERRKWIHCFEEVTAIFFIVAISEYDQKLREDEQTNRLVESLTLFEEICRYEYFFQTPIILFLNKVDLFEKKLTKIPLERFFTEYTGGPVLENGTKFF